MIAEFILARVAEDEAVARMADAGPDSVEPWALGICDFGPGCAVEAHPARVLRQCEAIRGAVKWATIAEETGEDAWANSNDYATALYAEQSILRALASIWSDHPDYRAEWKP